MSESTVIVLVESRQIPEISDTMYHLAREEFNRLNLGISRVTVPKIQDLILAVRMMLDVTKGGITSKWIKPSAYILVGGDYSNAWNSTMYQDTIRMASRLSTEFIIPIIPSILLLSEKSRLAEELEKSCAIVLGDAIESCMALIELHKKLHTP